MSADCVRKCHGRKIEVKSLKPEEVLHPADDIYKHSFCRSEKQTLY